MTDLVERLRKWGHEVCQEAATALEAKDKELAALTDPVAVHLNMLRGGIAKPSWANIRHLYPTEFAEIEARAARAITGKD